VGSSKYDFIGEAVGNSYYGILKTLNISMLYLVVKNVRYLGDCK
jgi:hypothetical protein